MEDGRKETLRLMRILGVGKLVQEEWEQAYKLFVVDESLVKDFQWLICDCHFHDGRKMIPTVRLLKILSLRKGERKMTLDRKKELMFRLRTKFECKPIKKSSILKEWGYK